jgi:hypothetical protein
MHARQRGIIAQPILNGREMSVHHRTERRERTLGIDEREHDRGALERGEHPLPAVLIDKPRIGHRFAWPEQLEAG